MNELLRLTVFLVGGFFAVANGYLLIKRKVTERTGILWLAVIIITLLIATFPTAFNRFARMVGVSYPPSLLFLFAILSMFSVLTYQSIQLATQERKLREVVQIVAILENELSRLAADESLEGTHSKSVRREVAEQH